MPNQMLLYQLFIFIYPKIAWLLSFFNPKAKKWIEGRKGLISQIEMAFKTNQQPVIWMHCASYGEYEQGLPILEKLKAEQPQYQFLVTFFSPSGFESRKTDGIADHYFYLPMDSPRHAKLLLEIVKPKLVLFVKYEFWYYYLQAIAKQKIPLLLIAGIFRKEQAFFRRFGKFHKSMLDFFNYLLVQDAESARLLESIGMGSKVQITGDTRFDRVIQIEKSFIPNPAIEQFTKNQFVMVAGSTWPEDDKFLALFAKTHPSIKIIVAPHDIEKRNLHHCKNTYEDAVFYSQYLQTYQTEIIDNDVLIIDNLGLLRNLYQYAAICYVGGGFNKEGIHNILEPAVFAKPIVFGPNHEKYLEGAAMIQAGGGFAVINYADLVNTLDKLILQESHMQKAGELAGKFVQGHSGATEKTMELIYKNRLLTN